MFPDELIKMTSMLVGRQSQMTSLDAKDMAKLIAQFATTKTPQQIRDDLDDHIFEEMKKRIFDNQEKYTPGFTTLKQPDDSLIQLKGTDDDYRYIVLNKQVQKVHSVENFLAYHKKNPSSLQGLLTNAYWATYLNERILSSMYNSSKSNRPYQRPHGKKSHKGVQSGGLSSHSAAYGITYVIPMMTFIHHSINWLQGIIMEAYGADGIDIIAQAKQDAVNRRVAELSIK